MTLLLAICSVAEILTGLAAVADPQFVVQLLFGSGIAGAGAAVSRLAGIALIALGISCRPRRDRGQSAAVAGMVVYNLAAAALFAFVGVRGELAGMLLWPAAVLHAGLGLSLIVSWRKACIGRAGGA